MDRRQGRDHNRQHGQEEGKRQGGDAAEATTTELVFLQLASQGDMLRAILAILQVGAEQEGRGLAPLLEALVKQIGEQTMQLKQVAVAVAKLGRDLPLDLVAAIDDNLDIPRRAEANGQGRRHANGRANGDLDEDGSAPP